MAVDVQHSGAPSPHFGPFEIRMNRIRHLGFRVVVVPQRGAEHGLDHFHLRFPDRRKLGNDVRWEREIGEIPDEPQAFVVDALRPEPIDVLADFASGTLFIYRSPKLVVKLCNPFPIAFLAVRGI